MPSVQSHHQSLFINVLIQSFDLYLEAVVVPTVPFSLTFVWLAGSPLWSKERNEAIMVQVGVSLVLQCRPPAGLPPPVIFWMDNSEFTMSLHRLSMDRRYCVLETSVKICIPSFIHNFVVHDREEWCFSFCVYWISLSLTPSISLFTPPFPPPDFARLPQNERVSQALNGDLYFSNVLPEDTRNDYICYARFPHTQTIQQKQPITITVLDSKLCTPTKCFSIYIFLHFLCELVLSCFQFPYFFPQMLLWILAFTWNGFGMSKQLHYAKMHFNFWVLSLFMFLFTLFLLLFPKLRSPPPRCGSRLIRVPSCMLMTFCCITVDAMNETVAALYNITDFYSGEWCWFIPPPPPPPFNPLKWTQANFHNTDLTLPEPHTSLTHPNSTLCDYINTIIWYNIANITSTIFIEFSSLYQNIRTWYNS